MKGEEGEAAEERRSVFIHAGECSSHPFLTLNCSLLVSERIVKADGFVDSGASINAVTPEFVERLGLMGTVHERHTMISLTMANSTSVVLPKRTVELAVHVEGWSHTMLSFSYYQYQTEGTSYLVCHGFKE